MAFIMKMIKTLGYNSAIEAWESFMPSFKYSVIGISLSFSVVSSIILKIFGINSYAFIGLFVLFLFEVLTGLVRARKIKEPLSSHKFGRFLIKVTHYMIAISIPYLFYVNFKEQGNEVASFILSWLHTFFIVQIVVENLISVSENVAIIEGKEKSHYIEKLQGKIDSLLKL